MNRLDQYVAKSRRLIRVSWAPNKSRACVLQGPFRPIGVIAVFPRRKDQLAPQVILNCPFLAEAFGPKFSEQHIGGSLLASIESTPVGHHRAFDLLPRVRHDRQCRTTSGMSGTHAVLIAA